MPPIEPTDWRKLPELERNLIAYCFHIDYGVEPDPAILEELEGNE